MYETFQWKSLSKEEEYLPANHFIIKGKNILLKEFGQQSIVEGDFVDVEIIFGVKDISKDKLKWWDPSGVGEPIWDKKFDIADPAS